MIYNNYPMQNPYSYPQQRFQQDLYNQSSWDMQQRQELTRVTGVEGAKAYQMNANSTVALFDSNEDLMYIKSTDGAGFPTIRTFAFSEVFENNTKINNEDYVSKNEFEKFKQEVAEYVQQFISEPKSKSKTTDKSTDN